MTETIRDIPPESLDLKAQHPMVVPGIIKDLELVRHLPLGDIAYFDVAEPDNFRLVNRETWQGKLTKGVEKRILREEKSKHGFAAIILHTPARTEDASHEEEIGKLFRLLARRTPKKENGKTVDQRLAMLFVVEEKGKDRTIGWRQDQLRRNGLVAEKTRGGSVIITDSHIISFGRREKLSPVINLEEGPSTKHMIPSHLERIHREADARGQTADTSELEKALRMTKKIRRDLDLLKDGGLTTYTDSGGEVVERSDKGADVPITQHGREIGKGEKDRAKQRVPMPGDRVVLDQRCGDCGENLVDLYYQRPGRVRYLLFRKTVCEGTQHKDGDTQVGPAHYIRPLEKIPRNK